MHTPFIEETVNARVVLAAVTILAAPAAIAQSSPAAGARQAAPAPAKPPYKTELPAALVKKARITEPAAAAAALARVPGGRITGVELEEEDGKFIYSYDITVAGKKGVEEVHVDAMTGAVIKSEHESETSEKAAKKPDSTTRKSKAPAKQP
ncbi:MAG: PepSY domain-containing protein [Gemmatimonadota bacterium]|nr:PepSY domain-containing protein [Gemmatimonadota bacterium]